MMCIDLLPDLYGESVKQLENIGCEQITSIQTQAAEIGHLGSAMEIDDRYLYTLGQDVQTHFWSDLLSLNEKRQLVAASPLLHAHKGTIWAILEVLKAIGLSDIHREAVIIEYKDREEVIYHVPRDGSVRYDHSTVHNDGANKHPFVFRHWAEFAVILKVPATRAKAELARKFIEIYKPVRAVLLGFIYDTLLPRDGGFNYDGTHTHGAIDFIGVSTRPGGIRYDGTYTHSGTY